jgi:exodeoxyribonuclease VII small subunit
MQTNQMTYRQAMAELKTIVERLRDAKDVDVDELVAAVTHAKELIDFCGAKIKKADAKIKDIVAELQTAEGSALAELQTAEGTTPKADPCGSSSRNADGAEDIPF